MRTSYDSPNNRKTRQLSIQNKQLTLAVVVSVLPLLIVGQIINGMSIEQIRTDVKSMLQQVVRDKGQAIEQWLSERKADINLLASNSHTRAALTGRGADEFIDFFREFSEQYGVYKAVALLDRRNEEVLRHSFEPGWEGLPRLPEGAPSEVVISKAFLWQGDAHLYITATIESDGNSLGTAVVVTSLAAINAVTNDIQIGSTGEAYLVNSDGFFVTHMDQSRVLSQAIKDVEPINRLIAGPEKEFVADSVDYQGIPVLGAYYSLPEMGWGLVAEQDVEEAFGHAHALNRTVLWVVLVSSLLTAAVAYVLTKSNLRPLGTLRSTIKRIREGEHDVRFPVRLRDEIGLTGEVFNEMLERLEAAQKLLQKRVEAADRELVAAHRELQARHEDLVRAQNRLLRSERLSTMGAVAAGLAHEINNPLATIRMLLESLEDTDTIDPEEREQALGIIAEEIDKIASMIERFMGLTHPREMRWEPVVIERVIDRTVALLRPKLDKAGVSVEISVPRELPSVIGDERQLGQLLLNLILNSISAMPAGGRIGISATRFDDQEQSQRYLRLRINDSGIGIAESDIGKVFNPFFTTRTEGTGLGLSIVARIVESHKGRIKVRSAAGAGTTFYIDLPENKG